MNIYIYKYVMNIVWNIQMEEYINIVLLLLL